MYFTIPLFSFLGQVRVHHQVFTTFYGFLSTFVDLGKCAMESPLSALYLRSWPWWRSMISIDQYCQRVGLFYAKSKIVYTRKIKLDFASFFLSVILLTILSIAPLYMHLFHFFYQQLLPNVDGLLIKIINAFARKFNKKPFLEPRLQAKPQGNPDILLFLCTPFIPTCRDPIELTMLTLLLLICTPLLASWSLWTLRNSPRMIRYLPCPDKKDCLTILMIYYNAHCDRLLLHGDVERNPGPPLSYIHWNINSLSADKFACM